MRKFTIKSLLITAMLCLGTSAWAQTTTEIDPVGTTQIHAGEADVAKYDANATSWTCTISSISGGSLKNSGNPSYAVITKFDATEVLEGKVPVSATLKFHSACTVSGKNSRVDVASISTAWDAATATWNNTNPSISAVYCGEGGYVGTAGADVSIDVTELLSNSSDGMLGFAIYTYTGREQRISDIKLEIVAADASSAVSYTINYVDENNEELKSVTVEGAVIGSSAIASDEDLASFFNEDKTKKYIYKSGNEEITLDKDATKNVITLVFREAATCSYTIKSNLGSTIASGSNFEGETITYGYPQYQVLDGTLYSTSVNSKEWRKTFTLNEDEQEITVNYTATSTTGVVYHVENENIEGVNVLTANNANIRCSNAAAAWSSSDVVLTTLDKGTYKLVAQVFSPQSTGGNQTFKVGGVTINFITGNSNTTVCESEFMVTDNEDLVWSAGGGNRNGIDFVYVVKLSDELSPVTTTITDAGYATFSSAYAVDFSESGLTAYTATVNETEKTVTLTSIADGIVPANTGVVLKGAAGEYTGTITTTEATYAENALVANAEAVTGDGTIYVLNTDSEGKNIGFYPLASGKTLAAGKAYLQLTSGAKGYTFVWNDGETTGIEEIYEFGTMNSDAATFDLSGRKVANPAKGLYIKNGKKFIVK